MIPIRLDICNIDSDEIQIDLFGFIIKHNDMYYIVTVHLGLPIKDIHIIGIPKINNYIISKRNDLLIIPILFPIKDQFVFRQFGEKQIDYNETYYCNDTKIVLNSNVFLPINMIPNYPTIMYHICCVQGVHNTGLDDIKVGMPIHNIDNKLRGLVSKMDDNIYVIPSHYIINTITKDNNLVQMKNNIDYIMKIDNKIIKNDKIYCKYHKTYIPIDSYVAYHMDVNITNKQNITKKAIIVPYYNRIINSNEIIRKDKDFEITSGYLNLLQILGQYEMIERIIGT
jgi:hypothetical protein